jgi:alkanesulfonate monooxygenase SsuD/methylene tetrahydromethanopterin reductase-like flavin-dependent oxidoreductase (luciferase family)
MELGAHLPLLSFQGEQRDLVALVDFAQAARDLGCCWLAANDHLTFSRPWLDGPTALAATIGSSGDLTLATTVALPVIRGAAATAKALAAIDVLSGGRLVAGVGPGSSERDHELAGTSFADRWRALDRAIDELRRHWAGPEPLEPRPVRPDGPPLWIGSWGSEAGLRRVARRGDGWLASAYNTTPPLFASAAGRLAEVRGGPMPNAVATCWTFIGEEAEAERMLRDVLAPLVRRDPDELRDRVAVGPPERVADLFAAYADAGAERLLLWPLADDVAQLERALTLR